MSINSKQLLASAGKRLGKVKMQAASTSQAVKFLNSVFKKYDLGLKAMDESGGDDEIVIRAYATTRYGSIDLQVDLQFDQKGKAEVNIDLNSADLFRTNGLYSDSSVCIFNGKRGLRYLEDFNKQFLKTAAAERAHIQFIEDWLTKFYAAMSLIHKTMEQNPQRLKD